MRYAPCAASGPPSGRGSGTWGTKEEEEEKEAKVYGSSQQTVFMKGCQVSILFRMVAT